MPPSPRTIPAVLRAAAEAHADRAAYVEGERVVTYRDLLHRVRETAAGYRSLGLETGDRVVVWAPNSIDWAVSALAVSYAGGVLVPANSRYTGH
jgi:acyl-CoA synthetase (AMP-forming)/AMP-acid ligase II